MARYNFSSFNLSQYNIDDDEVAEIGYLNILGYVDVLQGSYVRQGVASREYAGYVNTIAGAVAFAFAVFGEMLIEGFVNPIKGRLSRRGTGNRAVAGFVGAIAGAVELIEDIIETLNISGYVSPIAGRFEYLKELIVRGYVGKIIASYSKTGTGNRAVGGIVNKIAGLLSRSGSGSRKIGGSVSFSAGKYSRTGKGYRAVRGFAGKIKGAYSRIATKVMKVAGYIKKIAGHNLLLDLGLAVIKIVRLEAEKTQVKLSAIKSNIVMQAKKIIAKILEADLYDR